LILFDKQELKEFKTSPEYIELTFNQVFSTKTYSGNSEAVLMVTIPNSDMESCDVGQMMVRVNRTTTLPLEEVALRIVDLNESKTLYRALLAEMELKNANSNGKKKKDRDKDKTLITIE